ncbi:hypothetical protein [Salininema proteolyticum]|uniref:Uncharacterized protein n=1 Tax=Salininema proteolyticum TaxID=1607685 RepID=A0ABV8TYX7_9ACTN
MSQYERATVEMLMPYMWGHDYAYGIHSVYAADPDMPRGRANPAEGCTLWAVMADLKRAWVRADLTDLEREVIVLVYGARMGLGEVAAKLRVEGCAVETALYEGVGKLLDHLNNCP